MDTLGCVSVLTSWYVLFILAFRGVLLPFSPEHPASPQCFQKFQLDMVHLRVLGIFKPPEAEVHYFAAWTRMVACLLGSANSAQFRRHGCRWASDMVPRLPFPTLLFLPPLRASNPPLRRPKHTSLHRYPTCDQPLLILSRAVGGSSSAFPRHTRPGRTPMRRSIRVPVIK